MRIRLTFFILLLAALTLAACGGGTEAPAPAPAPESAPPAGETLNIAMYDMYFGETGPTNLASPISWEVTSGTEVTLNLENKGALQHNWAIVKPGVEVPNPYTGGPDNPDLLLFNAGVLDGGMSETVTFTAPEPGEYLVICTVAGHYPVMQGTLIVK